MTPKIKKMQNQETLMEQPLNQMLLKHIKRKRIKIEKVYTQKLNKNE